MPEDRDHESVQVTVVITRDHGTVEYSALLTVGGGLQGCRIGDGLVVGVGLWRDAPEPPRITFKLPVELPGGG